jgi:hypothetical protein
VVCYAELILGAGLGSKGDGDLGKSKKHDGGEAEEYRCKNLWRPCRCSKGLP